MGIPFLFELRTAIDWTWTDTSMPLFDFFNMENFYAVIYNLKCARNFERVCFQPLFDGLYIFFLDRAVSSYERVIQELHELVLLVPHFFVAQ